LVPWDPGWANRPGTALPLLLPHWGLDIFLIEIEIAIAIEIAIEIGQ
jgi:hypothetical protein